MLVSTALTNMLFISMPSLGIAQNAGDVGTRFVPVISEAGSRHPMHASALAASPPQKRVRSPCLTRYLNGVSATNSHLSVRIRTR